MNSFVIISEYDDKNVGEVVNNLQLKGSTSAVMGLIAWGKKAVDILVEPSYYD